MYILPLHFNISLISQLTMTSRCSQSAPASTIRWDSSPSLAKSPDSMEGAMRAEGLADEQLCTTLISDINAASS